MDCVDYNSPLALKNFMDENNMAMQKKFGQNFMVNPSCRKRIIDMLECSGEETVWEVGPGLGSMTKELLEKNVNVLAFEIDKGFIRTLEKFFCAEIKEKKLNIIEGDVLKNWEVRAKESDTKEIKLFGNLPYNIASTFIAETIEKGCIFDRCVFTVQKEVAERMCAKVNSSSYSAFSVLCQWKYDVLLGQELSPGNFWPRPKVSSKAVLLKRKKDALPCKDSKMLIKLIHALFSSRRKTIANNIKQVLPPLSIDIFKETGVNSSLRAENLNVSEFIKLSDCISS